MHAFARGGSQRGDHRRAEARGGSLNFTEVAYECSKTRKSQSQCESPEPQQRGQIHILH